MTRTLLTGAAGFTGRYMASELAGRGHEVHGVLHAPQAEPIAGLARAHEADLHDIDALLRIVGEVVPDYVVHLAAIAFVAHSDVEQLYLTNVVGTRHLLQALSESSKPPSSVLLASSANVYGNSREGMLDESVPPAPANDYGVSKVAMELVAKLYMPHLPIVLARPFNYTGRGQSPDFIIPKIVDHVRRGASVIQLGNLDVARDFSDVRTVTDAYARLLSVPEAIGGTYNIASGRAVALEEIIDTVSRLSGHELEVRVSPEFVRPNEVRTLCGSAARLEEVIGPLKSISLEETINWMFEN